MPKLMKIDRDVQEAMKERVREVVTVNAPYERIREALWDLGFQAKEDKPALALWENPEYELFLMIHVNPETGLLQNYDVRTFEETEGYE